MRDLHARHGVRALGALGAVGGSRRHRALRCGIRRARLRQRARRLAVRATARVLLRRRHAAPPAAGGSSSALAFGALGVLAALTTFGPYPRSMVGLPGDRISNMSPPTVCLAVLTMLQVAVVMLVRPAAQRWLQRDRVWTVTVAGNGMIMTIFLWHLTAALIAVGVLHHGRLPATGRRFGAVVGDTTRVDRERADPVARAARAVRTPGASSPVPLRLGRRERAGRDRRRHDAAVAHGVRHRVLEPRRLAGEHASRPRGRVGHASAALARRLRGRRACPSCGSPSRVVTRREPCRRCTPSNGGRRTGATWVAATGAFLLLAAATMFVATRWDQIPDAAKLAALVGVTGACALIGDRLRRTLPATGNALFHLGRTAGADRCRRARYAYVDDLARAVARRRPHLNRGADCVRVARPVGRAGCDGVGRRAGDRGRHGGAHGHPGAVRPRSESQPRRASYRGWNGTRSHGPGCRDRTACAARVRPRDHRSWRRRRPRACSACAWPWSVATVGLVTVRHRTRRTSFANEPPLALIALAASGRARPRRVARHRRSRTSSTCWPRPRCSSSPSSSCSRHGAIRSGAGPRTWPGKSIEAFAAVPTVLAIPAAFFYAAENRRAGEVAIAAAVGVLGWIVADARRAKPSGRLSPPRAHLACSPSRRRAARPRQWRRAPSRSAWRRSYRSRVTTRASPLVHGRRVCHLRCDARRADRTPRIDQRGRGVRGSRRSAPTTRPAMNGSPASRSRSLHS